MLEVPDAIVVQHELRQPGARPDKVALMILDSRHHRGYLHHVHADAGAGGLHPLHQAGRSLLHLHQTGPLLHIQAGRTVLLLHRLAASSILLSGVAHLAGFLGEQDVGVLGVAGVQIPLAVDGLRLAVANWRLVGVAPGADIVSLDRPP